MLALYLVLAQAPSTQELLGSKPEASDRELKLVGIDGCFFGPPAEFTDLVHAWMTDAVEAPHCRRRAQWRGEDATGLMILQLHVTSEGTVNGIAFKSEDMAAPTLEACLTRRLEKITVPANPLRGDTTFRMRVQW